MNIDSYYKVGLVMKAHGLKGDVTITFDDDSYLDWASLDSVFLLGKDNRLLPFFIESISVKGNKAYVKFEDIDGPEAATKISKSPIYLPKAARPKAGKGEFYDDEIIGFGVHDIQHGFLGKVTEVVHTGANKLLSVDRSGKEILIPVNSPLIASINKSKAEIIVNLPEGFLDI